MNDQPRHPLVSTGPVSEPTLTVELYIKWYNLWLVSPGENGEQHVSPVQYPDHLPGFDCRESPFRDHVPNPKFVAELAKRKGWRIHVLAWEMMVGRWLTEPFPCDEWHCDNAY